MSQKKTTRNQRAAKPQRGGIRLTAPAVMAVGVALALLLGGMSVWMAPKASTESADPLRISEVMAANASTIILSDGTMPDWIEVENTSGKPVDLTGYALLTGSKPSNAFAFPSGTLAPGGRIVVYCDGSGKSIVNGEYHAPFRLSASGETIALLNKRGLGVDLVETPALAKDQVYCRDDAGEWTMSDTATPGEANRVESYTADGDGEGSPIKVVKGAVEISEVMTRNVTFFADEKGEHPDYIEVHNTTASPVNLEGWALSDARDRLMRWRFPSVTLPAGGYLAVHCSGTENTSDPKHLHTNFKLNRDGEEVFLTDPNGVTTSYIKVPALLADEAYSLVETGWSKSQAPSPGYANDQNGADMAADGIRSENGYGVYITEVLASSNKSDDWIEIYNGSGQAVDLSGFGLSDNASRPRKWQFPGGTTIQPGQYMGVFANGLDTTVDGRVSTNYRLAAEGGYSVTLSDPQGNIFDRLFVPMQYQNISFGRPDTLNGVRYFTNPTPGAVNAGQSYYGRAPQPVYSDYGGLYKTGDVLQVTLSVPSNCRCYYTLDCTDPTEASTPYTGPITISETTILRTRVYGDGYMESIMDSQSYLYDVNNGDGTLFVMSLVSDPYNLTSDEAGIMVKGPNALPEYPYGSMNKGANFWMDWEREAHIEVWNPDGSTMLSQECGTKLHGQYSRAEKQKAFKIIARAQYGSNRFPAAIFSHRPYTEYQSFLLRSSSEDGNKTRFRDALLQRLAEGSSVMYQETEIGVLYIDGKYWGHYNLRERINTASICQFEGWEGEEDDLDLIKANTNVMQGSNDTMAALLEWIKAHKNDMNTDEAYNVLDQAIDITNYVEYMAFEMYTGNTDTLNVKRYRNPKRDGKWRWVLFDLDWGFHEDTNSVRRWLEPGGMGNMKRTDNTLFIACMKNQRFRAQFLTYLGEKMATTFSTEHILGMVKEFTDALEPILADQLERWGPTREEHDSEVRRFTRYAESRPLRMFQFLKGAENLHLTRDEMEQYFGEAMRVHGVTYDDIKAA
ncbi:MAG: lamin tail domain-containing protein [Clostridia bacterium]|nr:lamin tail domain-containing protein [Clostridia bacterium]